ncbi:MAG: hypothetical protein HYS21_06225 [Deltaproteobacteria bacterium]|nr:hypothetical protein [Deltaproteobacteria bacterium]
MHKERLQTILNLALIVILGLTALTWFRGQYGAVGGYDFATSLNPLDDLKRSIAVWDDRLYAGAPNVLSIGALPYFLLQYIFSELTGSLYRGQMLFFTLVLMLPGLTMFYFLRLIFKDVKEKVTVTFFGSIFYMLNTFVVVKWNRGELITLFSYGMLPIYLAFVERGLKESLNLKFILVFYFVLFFYPVTLGHSADFLIISALVASFGIWRLIATFSLRTLVNAVLLLVIAFLGSLWWFIPLWSGIHSGAASITSFTTNDLELVHYYSSWATLLNLMKMWFFSMYPTAVEFNTQFYRPGTLIFPVIAFAALLFSRNGYILFFSTASLVGLWLSKGTAPPFSGVYEWLYTNVPYFFIFRAPSRYFPLIYTFTLAVLLGYSVAKMTSFIKKVLPENRFVRAIPGVFVIALIFFHSWPIFSRNTIFRTVQGDILYPSIFFDIPPYYEDLNRWLKEQKGYFRVHSFNNQSYLNYAWGYSSTDISPKVIDAPQTVKFSQELIFGNSGFHNLLGSFDKRFWDWDFGGFEKFLGLLSVKYIAVTDDVLRRYQPDADSNEILHEVIGKTDGIKKTAQFGKAFIYENRFALPHAFASKKANLLFGDAGALQTLMKTDYSKNPVFLTIQKDEIDKLPVPEKSIARAAFVDSDNREQHLPNDGVTVALDGAGISQSQILKVSGTEKKAYVNTSSGLLKAQLLQSPVSDEQSGFTEDYSKGPLKEWLPVRGSADFSTGKGIILKLPKGEQAAGATKLINFESRNFDIEKYPYLKVTTTSTQKGYFDLDAVIGLDTDDDGWADSKIRVPVIRGEKEEPVNIGKLLKETFGYPGRSTYVPVRISFELKKNPFATEAENQSLTIKGVHFYYNLPSFKSKDVDRINIVLDSRSITAERTGNIFKSNTNIPAGIHTFKYNGNDRSSTMLLEITGIRKEDGENPQIEEVEIEKISPSKYIVKTGARANEPFWLVFNEAFNEGWKAYITPSAKERIKEAAIAHMPDFGFSSGEELRHHYMVNGYANAWWVDKPGTPIIIEFTPHRKFTTGVFMSIASGVISFIFVPFYGIAKKKSESKAGGEDGL